MRASASVAGGQPLSAELAGDLGLASDGVAADIIHLDITAGAVRAGLPGKASSRVRGGCRQSGATAFAVAVCGRLLFGVSTALGVGMACGVGARCLTLLGNTVQDRSLDLVGVGTFE